MDATLLLYDGQRTYSVPLAFYNLILELVSSIRPALMPGARYLAKQLVGPELWGTLDDSKKRLVGRCIVHMASHGRLPLRRVGCQHRHPVQYELIT